MDPAVTQPPSSSLAIPPDATNADRLVRATRSSRATWRRLVFLSVALSAALRFAHLGLALDTHVAELHRWQDSDMAFFHAWGAQIAGGEILGREPWHPLHSWHVVVFDDAARLDPSLGDPGDRRAAEAAWNRWYGGTQYHQAPLYPMLVGATYAVVGPRPGAVFAWQALLGVASTWLVALLGTRLGGRRVGVIAGFLHAGMPIAMYFETTLLRVSLVTFIGLAATVAACAALSSEGRARTLRWAATGLLCGLAATSKPTLVLLAAGFLVGIVLRAVTRSGMHGRVAADALALVAATGLVLAPVAARNVMVGAPAASLSSVGPVTFVLSNASDVPADSPATLSEHVAPILVATNGESLPVVRETLATWPSVGSFLESRLVRLHDAIRAHERPSNTNPAHARRLSPVLALAPVGMTLLAPLGLLGLVLGAARWRRAWPLLMLVGVHLLPLVALYVVARFRAPFAVALVPFAALAVLRLIEWVRARRFGRLAASGALIVLVAWASLVSRDGDALPVRASDLALAWQLHDGPRAQALVEAGDLAAAADVIAGTLTTVDPEMRRFLAEGAHAADEADLARAIAKLSDQRATLLERAGRTADASAERARGRALRASVE